MGWRHSESMIEHKCINSWWELSPTAADFKSWGVLRIIYHGEQQSGSLLSTICRNRMWEGLRQPNVKTTVRPFLNPKILMSYEHSISDQLSSHSSQASTSSGIARFVPRYLPLSLLMSGVRPGLFFTIWSDRYAVLPFLFLGVMELFTSRHTGLVRYRDSWSPFSNDHISMIIGKWVVFKSM